MTALVIAHRTCPRDAPENSLAGIRVAHDQGADVVEIDVRLTADAQPVLMHDPTLWRTTRTARRLDRTTLAGVRRLHLRGSGERVPTLGEALDALDAGQHVAIDVKDPAAAEAVLSEVRNQRLESRVKFWAQSTAAVVHAATHAPEIESALLRDAKRPDDVRQFLDDADADRCGRHLGPLVGGDTGVRRRGQLAGSAGLRLVQDPAHRPRQGGAARRRRHRLAGGGAGDPRRSGRTAS